MFIEVGEWEVLNDKACMIVRLIDKRRGLLITTEHDNKMVDSGEVHYKKSKQLKTKVYNQMYNQRIAAIDRTDIMLS